MATEKEIQDAIKNSSTALANFKNKKEGRDVFQSIESNPLLNHSEKQRVYREVAKEYSSNEVSEFAKKKQQALLDGQPISNTVMRGDSAGSEFISAYTEKYAANFINAMRHTAIQETARTKIPKFISQDAEIEKIGAPIRHPDGFDQDGNPKKKALSPQEQQTMEDTAGDLAKRIDQGFTKNLSVLSSDARKFYQSAFEPIKDDPETLNMCASNFLLLRTVNPKLSVDAMNMKGDPNLNVEGSLLGHASVVNLSYYNGLNKPTGKIGTKPQDIQADKMRNMVGMKHTKDAFKAIANGELDRFVQQNNLKPDDYGNASKNVQAKVNQMNASVIKGQDGITQKRLKREIANATTDIGDNLDHIAKLQARMDRLSSPDKMRFGDKVNAFFQGGVDKYKANTETALKGTIKNTADYLKLNQGTNLDKIVGKLEDRAKALNDVGDNLFSGGLQNYINSSPKQQKDMPMGKELLKQFQKNQGKISKVESQLESVKTVRDALGLPPKQQKKTDDLNLTNTIGNKNTSKVQIDSDSTAPKVNAPKTNTTTSLSGDTGIDQLAGRNWDKPTPQKPTVPKPKPEDGINALAKGEHLKEEDPNKKLNRTVGQELEGKLGQRVTGPGKRLSVH